MTPRLRQYFRRNIYRPFRTVLKIVLYRGEQSYRKPGSLLYACSAFSGQYRTIKLGMEVSSSGIHAVADQAKRFSRDLFNDITNIKDTLDKIHALEAESCTQEELLSAEDHLKKLKTAYITSHSKKELYALLTNPNPLQLLNDISEDSENGKDFNEYTVVSTARLSITTME
ncbi:uncharacterized protein TRIADDRAFT_54080 [Trichoplax adhaerens]|uniref:Uncharacterized protein n=1 Tax=Trichoplax adhaerens TaxID=10228 RepID=B3RR20_TRIAD|nr:predicted protein [Trichoplax adhaerens]EDV26264.1 predicted protein [Trichoplax adhaerens]|eukprot:XP_002110260.1 predicted protein [Trichoplax adhaerens]